VTDIEQLREALRAELAPILARLEAVETKHDALVRAIGAELVDEDVDPIARGFQQFAEDSRRRHSKERH
jgi:hypothetical protein